MGSSYYAGGRPYFGQRLCDADLQGLLAAAGIVWEGRSSRWGPDAEALARLFKAASQGNLALENSLLRRWGIRR